MNRIRLCAFAAAAMLTALSTAPAHAQSGPSLAVTLDFIAGKINAQGTFRYASTVTDTSGAVAPFTNQYVTTETNAAPDTTACRVTYHYKRVQDGKTVYDQAFWIPFGELVDVQVMSMEQNLRTGDAENGHASWMSQVSPPVFVVRSVRKDGGNELIFTDEAMADRVAKAIAHAAQLCGGLKPEAF